MAEHEAQTAKKATDWDALEYLPGFGGHFCSEALPQALPKGQNNPQKVQSLGTFLNTHEYA